MKAYLVWEIVDNYYDDPEDGGREFLVDIFLNYDKAKIFLEKKQKELKEDGSDGNISYRLDLYEIEE